MKAIGKGHYIRPIAILLSLFGHALAGELQPVGNDQIAKAREARAEEGAKLGAIPQREVERARQALEAARSRIHLVKAPAAGEASAKQADTSAAIKDLLQQRLATVAEIHELVKKAYASGEAGVDQVHAARAELLTAQLDLAETNEERIKVHQEIVQQAEGWTKVVAQMANAAQATTIDVLKAKAQLLEARIALERAKAAI